MFCAEIMKSKNEKLYNKHLFDFQSGEADQEINLSNETPISSLFNPDTEASLPNLSGTPYQIAENQIIHSESNLNKKYFESRKKNQLSKPFLGAVIRDEEYLIHAGDRIQVGSSDLYVLETQVHGQTESIISHAIPVNFIDPCNNPTGIVETCKICLESTQDSNEMMISHCECNGSCKYVHVNCFRNWVEHQKNQINKNPNSKFTIFQQKALSCDVCKQIIPWRISCGEQEFDIISINRPQNMNYILIEKIDPSGTRTAAMMRDFPVITIGRNISCNIVLHDTLGSRTHAKITLKSDGYYLKDEGSKFGTVAEIRNKLKMKNQMRLKYKGHLIRLKEKENDADSNTDDSEEESEYEKKSKTVLKKSRKIVKKF